MIYKKDPTTNQILKYASIIDISPAIANYPDATQAEIDTYLLINLKIQKDTELKLNYVDAQKVTIQTAEGNFSVDLMGEEWKTDIHKQTTDANIFGSATMINANTGTARSLTKDEWNDFYNQYNAISINNLTKKVDCQKQIQSASTEVELNNIDITFPETPIYVLDLNKTYTDGIDLNSIHEGTPVKL